MLNWVNRLFNEYRFVRRFVLFWMVGLLSGATYQVFWNDKAGLSSEYIALTGLLGVCFAFYQWVREREGD